MTTQFSIKTFDELTSVDIYHILRARSQVFVVEQNCAYQDMDELDFIPPEYNRLRSNLSAADTDSLNTAMSAIGRVLVLSEHRGQGIARQMMIQAIAHCRKKYGKKRPIIISAQTYLLSFYQSLGFVPEGDYYLEDNIEHVKMVLRVAKKSKVKKPPSGGSGVASKVLGVLLLLFSLMFVAGLIYLMT